MEYKFVLAESAQRHDDEVLHATHKRIHSRLRGYALQDHWDHLLAMALQIAVTVSKNDRDCENAPFYCGAVEGRGRASSVRDLSEASSFARQPEPGRRQVDLSRLLDE